MHIHIHIHKRPFLGTHLAILGSRRRMLAWYPMTFPSRKHGVKKM